MADTVKDKPHTTPGGEPEPATEQPVARHQPGGKYGERQDGAGAGPKRADATEATPVGTRAASRAGPRQGRGGDDPFAAHRGEPAGFKGGAASGSGAGAGGGGAGESEEPDPDSASGGGREG